MRKKKWSVSPPEAHVPEVRNANPPPAVDQGHEILKVQVREALANVAAGRPDEDYIRTLMRLRCAHIDIQKYFSREFVLQTERIASACVKVLDGEEVNAVLPGHGLQSHLGLSFDIGNLGRAAFSKHESLISVSLGFVSSHTGALQSRCLGTPSASEFHTAKAQIATVLDCLHPGALTLPILQQRLACCGGDGAVVRGGPQAKHHGTAAANQLWEEVFARRQDEGGRVNVNANNTPEEVTLWGWFHRCDRAQCAAVTPWIEEVLDVCNELVRLFGVGTGRVLFRSVGEEIALRPLSVDTMSGTRKLASLQHAPANLLRNYAAYHRGFCAWVLYCRFFHSVFFIE